MGIEFNFCAVKKTKKGIVKLYKNADYSHKSGIELELFSNDAITKNPIRENIKQNFGFLDNADNSMYIGDEKYSKIAKEITHDPKIVLKTLIATKNFINKNKQKFYFKIFHLVQDGKKIENPYEKVRGFLEDFEVFVSTNPFEVQLRPFSIIFEDDCSSKVYRKTLYELDLKENKIWEDYLENEAKKENISLGKGYKVKWKKYKKMSLDELKRDIFYALNQDKTFIETSLSKELFKLYLSNKFKMFLNVDDNGELINETLIENKEFISDENINRFNKYLDKLIEITKYAIKHKLQIRTYYT